MKERKRASHQPDWGGLGLLVRTALHLRPAQVVHRARLRAQRAALNRWPDLGRRLLTATRPAAAAPPANPIGPGAVACSSPVGWPIGFDPLDAGLARHCPALAELASGRITLLGVTADLHGPGGWDQPDAPQLWRFHLHYWDWAWSLAADWDRAAARALFGRLWRSWQAQCRFGRGDAWLPYPAALRAWSWCGLHRDLVAGTGLEAGFVRELQAHACFLRRHLESDVGGNHLIKDLKALAGLAVFLGDERMLAGALSRLGRQLTVQVLPDGGHYERAPAYHCQVLADLIDMAGLLHAAGRAPGQELGAAIARMRRWLGAVLAPDGTVPLRGDGYPVPAELVSMLLPGRAHNRAGSGVRGLAPGRAAGSRPRESLLLLRETGLVRAAAGGWDLLADVGPPCPRELPAHAHADTLSCLLHVDGRPLLVDTGTSTYAAGPVRDYERSTAAHNTAEIDDSDSTEVWGAFRAGRRARVRGVTADGQAVGRLTAAAAHDGYRRLGGRPVHRRYWSLTSGGLSVDDEVTGSGRHAVTVRWHLTPGSAVQLRADGAVISTAAGDFPVSVSSSGPVRLSVEPGMVASGFHATAAAPVLTCRIDAGLPVRLSTCWRRVLGGTAETWRAV
jgi:uncharacterized heparinase superfamily protein